MTSADFDPSYGYAPHGPSGRPGGLGTRFFARLIDGILVNVVVFLVSLFLFDQDYWWLVTGLFSGVLMFGYFVLFEVSQGASPGKRLLGLSVHGPGGSPRPTAGQSAIRNSFTLLSVVPYLGPLLAFIAYIVIAVTISGSPTKQGKHDELAGGTQVLKV
ncbi:RDD family protein [Candidatus Mycobacterium wuenschmannii]|uniref:RDD family protein n=1 Tax=Candidatus Mycobacterium wuenschmannii TaxID=3027808 RepID=A0ABY8W264_9MYCO|nr:RDD family protein [Candidatus Mycobacterium wuenschmannii]WIM89112.1 RDD family protein [Candidatus Mycobacterium wuenschmannii]